jgi:hypothetical protein
LRRVEGGAKIFGVFRVKNHDFTPKNHIFPLEAVYEKHKLYQTRLYKYNLFKNIPYNLIFTTKFNEPSILITIISCDYLNLSLANEYAGDVTIPTRLSINTKAFSKRISQSDCSIQIKLYYSFYV